MLSYCIDIPVQLQPYHLKQQHSTHAPLTGNLTLLQLSNLMLYYKSKYCILDATLSSFVKSGDKILMR